MLLAALAILAVIIIWDYKKHSEKGKPADKAEVSLKDGDAGDKNQMGEVPGVSRAKKKEKPS